MYVYIIKDETGDVVDVYHSDDAFKETSCLKAYLLEIGLLDDEDEEDFESEYYCELFESKEI